MPAQYRTETGFDFFQSYEERSKELEKEGKPPLPMRFEGIVKYEHALTGNEYTDIVVLDLAHLADHTWLTRDGMHELVKEVREVKKSLKKLTD